MHSLDKKEDKIGFREKSVISWKNSNRICTNEMQKPKHALYFISTVAYVSLLLGINLSSNKTHTHKYAQKHVHTYRYTQTEMRKNTKKKTYAKTHANTNIYA